MSVEGAGNSALNVISSSYEVRDTSEKDDYLGMESFLTMLVAQLQNQDPLNPMDGTDFSAQLAEFSQLEQLINLNDSLSSMTSALGEDSEVQATDYLGKEVSGNANSIEVIEGYLTDGYYTIEDTAEVVVTIYDANGNEIRTLYPGQQEAGSYQISWNGTDNSGNLVSDGSYSYVVTADSGYGFETVSTMVTGTVESIVYSNGKAYLQVQGILLDPESLIQVMDSTDTEDSVTSSMDYLGQEISSSAPLVKVENGSLSDSELLFELETQEDATITLFDSFGNAVRTIEVPAEDTGTGTNSVTWDGNNNSGETVADGLYSYSVETASGTAQVTASGEISGIQYIDGKQYLILEDSGMLVSLASVTSIN